MPGQPADPAGGRAVRPDGSRSRRGSAPPSRVAALLDAGVPDDQVPRLERLFTTFCLGYALSQVNGRFSAGTLDPRGRRAQAAPGRVPAHFRLAKYLDDAVDWDREFAVDVEDLLALVARTAAR